MCSLVTIEIRNALCASFLSLFNFRRCLLRRTPSILPASRILSLSLYTKSATERHCYGPHRETLPNGHCFNGCHRESNETSLTKAVNCFILYPGPWRGLTVWGFRSVSGPSSHTLFRSRGATHLHRTGAGGGLLASPILCFSRVVFSSQLKEKLVWPASFLRHPRQSRGQKELPGQCQGFLFCADVTFKSRVASTVTECALVYAKTKAGLCQWKDPLCGPLSIASQGMFSQSSIMHANTVCPQNIKSLNLMFVLI